MRMRKVEKLVCDSRYHRKRAAEHAEKLLHFANAKENQHYLEVGCGNGAAAIYITKKYHLHVTGIDVDPEQIRCAKERVKGLTNIHFYVCDATNLPFQDSDFDIVATFGVMHHVSNWINALVEIKRVLKPGGYFIFFDLVYSRWMAGFWERFVKNYGFPTQEALTSFIERNRFSTIYSSFSKSFILHRLEAVYYYTLQGAIERE